MKNKIKVFILGSMCLTALCVGSVAASQPVNAEEFTIDLFTSTGAIIEPAYEEYSGLKIATTTNGDGASLKNTVAGQFLLTYAPILNNADSDMIIAFKDVHTNDVVELTLDYSKNDINASVSHNGDTVGLYYGGRDVDPYNKGLQGRSKGANAMGCYSIAELNEEHTITFAPESYSFYLDDMLIWSFVIEQNDGATAECLTGFEEYSVEISFQNTDNVETGMIIKEINGTSLKNHTYSSWETNLVVLNTLYAYEGVNYKIPKPYVYNLANGLLNPEDVNVKVFDEDGNEILSSKYTDNLSFIPNEDSLNYCIEYKYKDDNGVFTRTEVNVSCYTSETVNTNYVLSSSLEDMELGLNAEVVLPQAKVESEIYITGQSDEVYIDIYKDGEIYADYEKMSAKARNTVEFNDVGEYNVRFYSACEYVVDYFEKSIVVSSDILAYDIINVNDIYAIDTKLLIPIINFYYKGETYSTESKIIFPSGRAYSNKIIVLDELGNYTIEYSSVCGTETYTVKKEIQVVYTSNTAFTYDQTSNIVGFGTSAMTDKISGVHIITTANNSEIRYNEKIDLTQLNREVPLIELFADAKALGEEAFTKFTVKLIDAYDESNVVTITCEAKLTEVNGSYIKAGATGQSLQGYWNGIPQISTGFPSLLDFQGETDRSDVSMATLSVSMDYAERKVYSLNAYNTTVAEVTDYCVTDLDDPNIYVKPWNGFTTGECYVSVSVAGLTTTRVSYTIMTLAGKSLNENSIKVEDKPILKVDMPAVIPNGCVGGGYQIFAASAFDYYRNSLEVSARVYYAYDRLNQGELDIVDGKFTPQLPGTYTICYIAQDVFGNIGTKYVNIEVLENIKSIQAELGEGIISIFVGEKVHLKPVQSIEGGSGDVTYSVEIYDPSGELLAENNNMFIPTQEGKYQIRYVFNDYLGQTLELSYLIDATLSDKPTFSEEIILPRYFVSGIEYKLPIINAMDYSSGTATEIIPEIYVTDGGARRIIKDAVYLANINRDGQDVKVEYVYTSSNGEKTTIENTVKGILMKEGKKVFLEKYFVGDGVSFGKNDNSVYVQTEQTGAVFSGVKPLYAKAAKIIFSVYMETIASESITLTLTDSQNKSKVVEFVFRFDKDAQKIYCSINGATEKLMPTMLIENGTETSFGIAFNQALGTWDDVNGAVFETATTYLDGTAFDGFSETVYFDVAFGKVSSSTLLNIKQLNNQTFNNLTRDVIAPEIELGKLETNLNIGEVLITPILNAFDVLGNVVAKKISVQYSKSGQMSYVSDCNNVILNGVDATKTYQVKLDEYGEYIITFVAQDDAGREVSVVKNISILDQEDPVIVVNGDYSNEYKLNDAITIHSMSVTDNVDAAETLVKVIYIIESNGTMHRVNAGDSYKFKEYGTFTIRYFSYDASGNIALLDYKLNIQ